MSPEHKRMLPPGCSGMIVLAMISLGAGCATLEALEDVRRTSRVAGALESVIAAQDAGESRSSVCLEDNQERARALRITRLMGWEAVEDGEPRENCVDIRRPDKD